MKSLQTLKSDHLLTLTGTAKDIMMILREFNSRIGFSRLGVGAISGHAALLHAD